MDIVIGANRDYNLSRMKKRPILQENNNSWSHKKSSCSFHFLSCLSFCRILFRGQKKKESKEEEKEDPTDTLKFIARKRFVRGVVTKCSQLVFLLTFTFNKALNEGRSVDPLPLYLGLPVKRIEIYVLGYMIYVFLRMTVQ